MCGLLTKLDTQLPLPKARRFKPREQECSDAISNEISKDAFQSQTWDSWEAFQGADELSLTMNNPEITVPIDWALKTNNKLPK